MINAAAPKCGFPKLCMSDFRQMGDFIQAHLGIQMPDQKRVMVEARLRNRLIKLGFQDYHAYKDYLFTCQGREKEWSNFVDAITTNKTDFFREPRHFDYLTGVVVPELLRSKPVKAHPFFSMWSCACSRGDEPYTMAMVLQNIADRNQKFDFCITASDISQKMLQTACTAVYSHDEIKPVPLPLRKKYLLRSRNREQDLVRIAPDIRKKVRFRRINLVRQFSFKAPFDVIFCRNVTIYFDKPTTENLIKNLCTNIKTGGYLFVGHSEFINTSGLPLSMETSSVYRKTV